LNVHFDRLEVIIGQMAALYHALEAERDGLRADALVIAEAMIASLRPTPG